MSIDMKVNWNLCEGNGVCAAEAPEVFDLDDDDNLLILDEHPDDTLRTKVEAAASACPKRAISLS
ncbi:ferredoxin [Streptomyces sp. NPDC008092]|uniref:ferredoxin n=1 Tax=Streptomyces sp. NPDC008092 TaxID=3364808 RepID=UPI0036E960B9